MTVGRTVAACALALTLGVSSHATAEPNDPPGFAKKELAPQPSYSSLELFGVLGPTMVLGEAANPEYVQTFSRTGIYGELGVAYRSNYFVDPFLSVGYAVLATGVSEIPPGAYGDGGRIEQRLSTWVISPGITSDIWRFRPRLGLGLAVVLQKFEFQGETNSSSQLPVVTQLGLGFNAFDDSRFRLDLEARAVLARGADVTFLTLDAVMRGDLFYFVGR